MTAGGMPAVTGEPAAPSGAVLLYLVRVRDADQLVGTLLPVRRDVGEEVVHVERAVDDRPRRPRRGDRDVDRRERVLVASRSAAKYAQRLCKSKCSHVHASHREPHNRFDRLMSSG